MASDFIYPEQSCKRFTGIFDTSPVRADPVLPQAWWQRQANREASMTITATKVHILIIDDHTLFRESVTRLLNAESDFDVIADCGTIAEALRIISSSKI